MAQEKSIVRRSAGHQAQRARWLLLSAAWLIAVAAVVAPVGAAAQQVQRIAAIVNDEVISLFDVSERIDLVISSTGLPNTREQQQRLAPEVLRRLIDERLQAQEAARLNIQVTQRDIDSAIAGIEQSNNIPKGRFEDFLKQRGIAASAAKKQIEAELAWQKLVARHIVPNVEVGEEEIDEVLRRIEATRDAEQLRLSEILLTTDEPGNEAKTRDLANQLVGQIRKGADFRALARQFSKSATAATGGDIGWVQEGQLEATATAVVDKLEPGEVSNPVETPDGLVIYRLDEKRRSAAPSENEREIALRQVVLRLDRDATEADIAARAAQARELSETAKGCDQFAAAAERLEISQPDTPTRIRLGDLNENLREIVAALDVGIASEPIRSPVGIQVVMVCERSDLAGPPREEIREVLLRQRIDLRARRYLRDLRRAAFVDLRV
jgi:peptidyl-prolyl cis-trans isomerase SurA